jgi:Ankyrin repeats (3 copies)
VNARGAGRFTSSALHLAAENSNVLIVSFLLRCEGIDVDAVNVSGQTALNIAARTGSAAIAQLLLKSGADVYITSDQGHTPFFGKSLVLCCAQYLAGNITVLKCFQRAALNTSLLGVFRLRFNLSTSCRHL